MGIFTKETIVYIDREMSENELLEKAVAVLGNVWDTSVDKASEKKLFEALSSIEDMAPYLRDTLAQDVKRYFSATTDKERDMIRGAMARTMYWRGLLRTRGEKPKKTLDLKRYA